MVNITCLTLFGMYYNLIPSEREGEREREKERETKRQTD
jgi:hypothetical protein